MSARWWELSCPACGARSTGIPSAGASDPGRGQSTRAGTLRRGRGYSTPSGPFLCGRVRFARAGTGILSPDAQDVPGCTGLSPPARTCPVDAGGPSGRCGSRWSDGRPSALMSPPGPTLGAWLVTCPNRTRPRCLTLPAPMAPASSTTRPARWPTGCARGRSTTSSARTSCSPTTPRWAAWSRPAACHRSSCGARRAAARRRSLGSWPTAPAWSSSRSRRPSPGWPTCARSSPPRPAAARSGRARSCSSTRSTASTAPSRTPSCPTSRTEQSSWSARPPRTRASSSMAPSCLAARSWSCAAWTRPP